MTCAQRLGIHFLSALQKKKMWLAHWLWSAHRSDINFIWSLPLLKRISSQIHAVTISCPPEGGWAHLDVFWSATTTGTQSHSHRPRAQWREYMLYVSLPYSRRYNRLLGGWIDGWRGVLFVTCWCITDIICSDTQTSKPASNWDATSN